MSYFYVEEPAEIPYQVLVGGAPGADESKATVHRREPAGDVARTVELAKQGPGVLKLEANAFKVDDSPLFIEFAFKAHGSNDETKTLRAIALAEPVPAKVTAEKPQAKPGDKVKLEVKGWAALVYDTPDKATESEETDIARVPAPVKKDVRWKVDGKDVADKGTSITFAITDEHAGKILPVEAYLGDTPPGRATTQIDCSLLELQLHDDCYKPCGGTSYELTLASGEVRKGTTDGSGWLKEPIPSAKQVCKITFTPAGAKKPIELAVYMTDAAKGEDDWYLCQLKTMGFTRDGTDDSLGIVCFQAAYGNLPLTGALDDDTKAALDKLLGDGGELKKSLFDEAPA
jgi:hypothetical protein